MSKIATPAQFDAQLEEFPIIGGLRPAVVEKVEGKTAKIYVRELGMVTLPWEKLSWARRELPDEQVDRAPTDASEILTRGDVIYTVGRTPESLLFVRCPRRKARWCPLTRRTARSWPWLAASISSRASSTALFRPGASPARDSSRLFMRPPSDKGYTPASVVLDAPVVIDEEGNEKAWRPKEFERANSPARFRLRDALAHSKNLVSVRLMRAIGGEYTRNYVTRFGFDKSQLPDDLTLALGTAQLKSTAGRHRLLRPLPTVVSR